MRYDLLTLTDESMLLVRAVEDWDQHVVLHSFGNKGIH